MGGSHSNPHCRPGADGTTLQSVNSGAGAAALGGLAIGKHNRTYTVDRKANRVLRVSP